ncbi:hypothetical protein INR49_009330 [Caranx melampygus]|nr:hypothetical protein INR49_009330 [Caranx melampygus]
MMRSVRQQSLITDQQQVIAQRDDGGRFPVKAKNKSAHSAACQISTQHRTRSRLQNHQDRKHHRAVQREKLEDTRDQTVRKVSDGAVNSRQTHTGVLWRLGGWSDSSTRQRGETTASGRSSWLLLGPTLGV